MHSIAGRQIKIIEADAFRDCDYLTEVEFGDKLETIGNGTFYGWYLLRIIPMLSVRTIGLNAFYKCFELYIWCGMRWTTSNTKSMRIP